MIPLTLSLRNFMCYRDNVPALSFEGIHTACLCGDNGNGKSALLDALTWAVWGKARARSDDELIYLGRPDMEVDFQFQAGGERYRILRKRGRARPGRSGQTVVELQVAGPDGFRAISGNTLTETQEQILRIVGMDYATFINSAFLRQGHADEFTIKQPWERKKVLADILGLSYYDDLEARAKDVARSCARRQAELGSAIAEMDRELARRDEYLAELAQAEHAVAGLAEKAAAAEQALQALRAAKKDLDFQQEQLGELRRSLDVEREGGERWRRAAADHRARRQAYAVLLAQGERIETGHIQLKEIRALLEQLNAKLGRLLALSERRSTLEKAIALQRGELAAELRQACSRAAEMEKQSMRLAGLLGEHAQARLAEEQLDRVEVGLAQKKEQLQQMALQMQQDRTVSQRLTDEVKELREKLALLQQDEAVCPLCGTDLGAVEKKRIEERHRADIAARAEALRVNDAEQKRRSALHLALGKEIAQADSRLKRERPDCLRRLSGLDREIIEVRKAGHELEGQRLLAAELEARLKGEQFAPEQQRALQELAAQIASLDYDREAHRRAQMSLSSLEQYDELWRRLEEARANLPAEEAALSRAEEALARSEAVVAAGRERMAALSSAVAGLAGIADRLRQAEAERAGMLRGQAEAQGRVGAVRERLGRCAQLEMEREAKRRRMAEAAAEEEAYEELATAFGKKGIQAFIIESVVPEIEAEANELLARMTDNRMHVKIETQRDTRKGEQVETLDIRIADEVGTRSYEMYSGGEAFRINFALRIALSRLLARRAGAPLATLVIDEGFGTQDSAGLNKLVEAIHFIQDDFDKIIVITHLDELKDAFPVRIDVLKTAEGSTIAVS